LNEELAKRGGCLEVWFMARSEPGRLWKLYPEEFGFPFRFAGGINPIIQERQFHFNPSYLWQILKKPPTWLLVSGSWYFPTAFLGNWIARITRAKTILWNESNLQYVEHKTRTATLFRRTVMDNFDAYVVPGQWAREYVLEFAPSAPHKPILPLPNVIDETLFRDKVSLYRRQRSKLRSKWEINEECHPVLFTAARLEPIKGIRELICAITSSKRFKPATLLIAGDGVLRYELQSIVAEAGLQENIHFLGFLNEAQILEILALADGFILPSLGDPYPLAVIEAAFAGLPLLLSNRVGCHLEVLVPQQNGILFDPYDQVSIQNCLEHFLNLEPQQWVEMGYRSLEIAEERFCTNQVVSCFVDALIKL
jgi:glycosyltransferase involved in cell wall biosynthesis